ncbi:sigma-54-dependent Fis family transcriptional regulator [Nevskia ramosa]|nr:sigma-54-dependent Fis family transcriptional regulator [Nevskia ramosa]
MPIRPRSAASRPPKPGAGKRTAPSTTVRPSGLHFPNIRDIASHLHFSPDRGRIWLDDRRMVLLHVEAFHSLRKELVALVGVEAARGLVTRMGYVAGCRDAEFAKRARPQASSFDAFSVGPQLHALKGMAEIELLKFRMDIGAGILYSEFLFKDSFEDEAQLPAAPFGEQSACWMLAGYASGYASTFMGKRILVREVECRANGHAQCRAIAKPVEDWADPELDLPYLQPLPTEPSTRSTGRTLRAPRPQPSIATAALARGDGSEPVGGSAAFSTILHQINRVAATRATVLLLGESGVGKSLFAREVHDRSPRRTQTFVAVNCAAIPEELIESELFGVERGAYTGASVSRAGRFELADGGTLFLDEIATLSPTAQGKLLRVLQSGEFERLGSTTMRKVDVRVIAATNADLQDAIRRKRFREDLYFRLHVFPIVIPPLRERRDDIPLLVGHYLAKFSKLHERHLSGITPPALAALLAHDWPGNVRELENVLERAVILADEGQALERSQLFAARTSERGRDTMELGGDGELVPTDAGDDSREKRLIDDFAARLIDSPAVSLPAAQDRVILAAWNKTGHNVSAAAKLLGLSRAQLDYRLKKLQQGSAPSKAPISKIKRKTTTRRTKK